MAELFRAKHFLLQAQLLRDRVPSFPDYPFSLEAMAVAWGLNPEGGCRNFNFATRASHSPLHKFLRLTKGVRRPRDSFFLRAESFFTVATEVERLDAEPGGSPIIRAYGGHCLHEMS